VAARPPLYGAATRLPPSPCRVSASRQRSAGGRHPPLDRTELTTRADRAAVRVRRRDEKGSAGAPVSAAGRCARFRWRGRQVPPVLARLRQPTGQRARCQAGRVQRCVLGRASRDGAPRFTSRIVLWASWRSNFAGFGWMSAFCFCLLEAVCRQTAQFPSLAPRVCDAVVSFLSAWRSIFLQWRICCRSYLRCSTRPCYRKDAFAWRSGS
jgi:hypothetical protein